MVTGLFLKIIAPLSPPLDKTDRAAITSSIKPTGRVVAQHTLRANGPGSSENDSASVYGADFLKSSFLLQNQVQYHFSTQQNAPNTILPLSEFSCGFKERKIPYKLVFFHQKKRYLCSFGVIFPASHLTPKPPRDLIDILKWTL